MFLHSTGMFLALTTAVLHFAPITINASVSESSTDLVNVAPTAPVNGTIMFSEFPADVKEDFALKLNLTDNYEEIIGGIFFQDTANIIKARKCNGKEIEFDILLLSPTRTLSSGTECRLDNSVVNCPVAQTEFKRLDNGVKVTVAFDGKRPGNYDPSDIDGVQARPTKSIQVVDECGVQYYSSISRSAELIAVIPEEAFLEDNILPVSFNQDGIATSPDGRNLRAPNPRGLAVNPACPDGPTTYIDLALIFDSSFCAKVGNFNTAVSYLERAVANVASMYEQSTCTSVRLGHLEGWCNEAKDPTSVTGTCGQTLTALKSLLDNNSHFQQIGSKHDLLHLVTGGVFPESTKTLGCAYTNVLCRNPSKFAASRLGSLSIQSRIDVVLAHEMGHNAGSNHDSTGNSGNVDLSINEFIMEAAVNDGEQGFSSQSLTAFDFANRNCLNVLIPECSKSANCGKDVDCQDGLLCASSHTSDLVAAKMNQRQAYCSNLPNSINSVCYSPRELETSGGNIFDQTIRFFEGLISNIFGIFTNLFS